MFTLFSQITLLFTLWRLASFAIGVAIFIGFAYILSGVPLGSESTIGSVAKDGLNKVEPSLSRLSRDTSSRALHEMGRSGSEASSRADKYLSSINPAEVIPVEFSSKVQAVANEVVSFVESVAKYIKGLF